MLVSVPDFPLHSRLLTHCLLPAVARLQVEALDCYLVHSPVATFNSIRTLANSLATAVESGLTKAVGVPKLAACPGPLPA